MFEPLIFAVFVLVFMVCLRVLPEMGFNGVSGKVLALCVATLSAMGVAMLGNVTNDPRVFQPTRGIEFEFVLLPYAALGLSLLLLLLLLLLIKATAALNKLRARYTEVFEKPDRRKQDGFRKKQSDLRPREYAKSADHKMGRNKNTAKKWLEIRRRLNG